MALHRQFLFFVTALLLTPWISWGEETPVTSEVITTPKGTLQLRLSDGRVAELHSKTAGVAHYPIDLKMTDNTCGTPRSNCRMIVPMDTVAVSWVWTVHKDPQKIGKTVKFESDGQEFPLFEIPYNRDTGPNFPPSLHCDDFSWMSGENKLERFRTIFSWGSEINISNIETETNENNSQGGALDIKLNPNFGSYYTFQKLIHLRNIAFGDSSLFLTGPLSLTFSSPRANEICQVEFSPDVLRAIKISDRETKKREKIPYTESPTPLNKNVKNLSVNLIQFLPAGDFK